jgi:DNA polymerase I-like protein with 3'-5' exonuclease and polymerase domains
MTRLSELPDDWSVVVDTETSKLHPDDGGHIAVVSFAYRDPADGRLISQAVPFDQGMTSPLGDKIFDPNNHLDKAALRRIKKWPEWAQREVAPNRPPEDFYRLLDQFQRFRLTFHNAKFDLAYLECGLRDNPGRNLEDRLEWDTMLVQLVREPQMPKGLKPTAVRLELTDTGSEDAEAEALKPWLGPKSGKNDDARYDLVPWSVMESYARVDAELTLLLKEYQESVLDPEADFQFWKHYGREMSLCHVLLHMEARGVGFDVEGCRAAAQVLTSEFDAVAKRLPFKGGTGRPTPEAARKFFFKSPPQIQDSYDSSGNEIELEIPAEEPIRPGTEDFRGLDPFPEKMTKGGKTAPPKPQVDDEVVQRLVQLKAPWAEEYAVHEGLKSALSKWYEPWPALAGKDGRLRTVHKQGGTVSGRLAVGRIQLQAIPHDYLMPSKSVPAVRSFFQPRPGHELWEFDVSQAEIRLATAAAKCRPMLEGIQRGEDSHSIATKLMFEIDEDDPDWDQRRQVAKRCNLGILYGAGQKVIQEQLLKFTGIHYPLPQIKKWIDDWKRAFPEFVEALERAQEQAERWGYVRLHNGRERWFSDYEPSHKAFNQIVQGSLAEVMKDIMIDIDRLWPDELLLQIHDSVLLEIWEGQAAERQFQVCELMREKFEKAIWTPWEPGGEPVLVPFRSDAKQWVKAA